MAVPDSAYASWLKSDALYRGWANAGLPGALAPMSIDSEIISPFAASAAVDTEILRQGVFLGNSLALDQAIVVGKRVDLVGKCIQLAGDQLDYGNGVMPVEKVQNGTFDTVTTGWTPNNTTLSVVSAQLKVLVNVATAPRARQTISNLVAGKDYIFLGKLAPGNTADKARIELNGSALATVDFDYNLGFSNVVYRFTATGTTVNIDLVVRNSTTNGAINDFALFDDISLKEFAPIVLVIGAQEQDDGTTLLTVLRKL